MKALIFDPYLDTLGGGERYMMTAADCLLKNGFRVDVCWSNRKVLQKIKDRFNFDLEEINLVDNIFNFSFFKKRKLMKNYDLIFYLSDGSVPFLFGKKNILHFQVPFHDVCGRSLKNKVKFSRIDEVVCNSFFTKRVIDKEFGLKTKVLYPPVAVDEFKKGQKENIILSVGRFSDLFQAKRQDVLVRAFKKGRFPGWKLVLAGGTDVGKGDLFQELKKQEEKGKIEIIENPTFLDLKDLYAKSKIFWLAAGFGINEELFPERVEHFGMTTVEAMASGCVVIALKKGGQKEIISDGVNGFFWEKERELIEKTLKIIQSDDLRKKIALEAQKRSLDFSKQKFCQEFLKLVK